MSRYRNELLGGLLVVLCGGCAAVPLVGVVAAPDAKQVRMEKRRFAMDMAHLLRRARKHYRRGAYADSERMVIRLLKEQPGNLEAQVLRGKILLM